MIIIRPTSLTATLDTAAEALFNQQTIQPPRREELASLIINRQVQFGPNAGFFIPFAAETEVQTRLFTGEFLHTDFAISHFKLIECARILRLLDMGNPTSAHSLDLADERIQTMCYSRFCSKGECKSLTITFMRYLPVSSIIDPAAKLASFFAQLADYRDGNGKWDGFPFYYTLLMLIELNVPQATLELQYSALTCEKLLDQNWPTDPISVRRQAILQYALARRN